MRVNALERTAPSTIWFRVRTNRPIHRLSQGGENVARRKQEPIKVRAFVSVNGEYVDVDTLSPEMKQKLATQLMLKWMNAMFRGKAVFTVAEETKEKGA